MDGKKMIALLEYYQKYYDETGTDDFSGFSIWLNKQLNPQPVAAKANDANRMVVWLTHRLSKLFRWYAKDTLKANGLTSMDEYFFLISINKLGNPSKTEVYADTITEINTGTQMMRRMIDAGLIEEVIDTHDKRVRRVKLTENGKRSREGFLEQSKADLTLKTGNLTEVDKAALIRQLSHLEKFHTNIYLHDSDLSFKQLIEKHLLVVPGAGE